MKLVPLETKLSQTIDKKETIDNKQTHRRTPIDKREDDPIKIMSQNSNNSINKLKKQK